MAVAGSDFVLVELQLQMTLYNHDACQMKMTYMHGHVQTVVDLLSIPKSLSVSDR